MNQPRKIPMMDGNKTLLVDDDENILWVTKLILSEANFSVDTTCDPMEALVKSQSIEYSVFVIDYIMSKMKGDELAKKIIDIKRSNGLQAHIIFLTGYTDSVDYLETLAGNSNKVLIKPTSAPDLIEAIRSKIEHHR